MFMEKVYVLFLEYLLAVSLGEFCGLLLLQPMSQQWCEQQTMPGLLPALASSR
jgi:hypothetical protein